MGGTFCDWYGVKYTASGHVQSLLLLGNGLQGSIEASLITLCKYLLEFYVANNLGLTGPIPPELGAASNSP
jgi:hypothetical protein